jgi:hypothetical protein
MHLASLGWRQRLFIEYIESCPGNGHPLTRLPNIILTSHSADVLLAYLDGKEVPRFCRSSLTYLSATEFKGI